MLELSLGQIFDMFYIKPYQLPTCSRPYRKRGAPQLAKRAYWYMVLVVVGNIEFKPCSIIGALL